eukprot:Phypoly_transcript_03173.p1 GENE.Phypoly_transcript_03173~~Phypoly_transcript_03173.p1  ORF type:complete len:611 (+),score=162.60 Phypoly_transcript_03173:644-2476(+)
MQAQKSVVEKLRKDFEHAERVVEHEKSIASELNTTLQKMTIEKDRLVARSEEDQKCNKELKERIDSLTAEISALNSKLLDSTSQIEEVNKHKNCLLEEAELRRTELSEINQRHQVAERTIIDMKAENEALQTRIPQIEGEIARIDEANKSLQDLVEQTNCALSESQKELEAKNNKMLEIQSEIELKDQSIKSLEEASALQKVEIEKSQKLIDEYLTTIFNGTSANAEVSQANALLNSQLEERTSAMNSLQNQVKELTEAKDRMQQECTSLNNELSELQKANGKIESQLKTEIETTQKISTDMATGEKRAGDLERELEELRKANELHTKKLEEDLRAEASKLGDQHNAASAEWSAKEAALIKELESVKESLEERLTKQQDGFDNMKAGLLAEVRRVDEAHTKERKEFQDKVALLAKDLEKYKGLYTEAQKAMDAAKAQLGFSSTPKRDEGKKKSESDEKAKGREEKRDERAKERSAEKRDEKAKDRSAEKRDEKSKDRSVERHDEKAKEKGDKSGKRAQPKASSFYVNPNEVPTELEPDDNPTSDDDVGKKKRKLLPSRPLSSSQPASPSKKVRFAENTKKASTYSKPRKATAPKSKKLSLDDDDVFTFKG